ncbi:MAG: hypothetical protein MRZ79_08145 [Bacteroidia bacterium]|nr:hypothetical protein [Bacteroidia bacterium]
MIEDNEADVFLFKMILENLQYQGQFSRFANGNAFLQAVEDGQNKLPQKKLIFIDLNLPVLDGWQIFLQSHSKEFFHDSLFVLVSNLFPQHFQKSRTQYSNLIFLEKEFEFDLFSQKVAEIIKSFGT